MRDLGVFLVWGSIIFLLVNALVSFIFLEFSLDRKNKRESDGTLRVKHSGFVIDFIYGGLSGSPNEKKPNNLCKLFWGIYFGLLVNYLLSLFFISICYGIIIVVIPEVYSLAVSLFSDQWWDFFKAVLFVVAVVIVIFATEFVHHPFSSNEFMPATKDWVKGKLKKVCPSTKFVD